jgi:hypothetical protein
MRKITALAAISTLAFLSSCTVEGRQPISVDLDGDGTAETVTLQQREKEIVVTIQGPTLRGGRQVFVFGVDASRQDAVCGLPVSLEVTEPECAPEALGAEPLEGCQATPQSQDLMLSDGLCDPIHMYWHRTERQVWWWRA